MKAYRNLIQTFEITGSLFDRPRSGMPRLSDIQIAENLDLVINNYLGTNSANAISKRIQIPNITVWKILPKIPKMHSCQIQ